MNTTDAKDQLSQLKVLHGNTYRLADFVEVVSGHRVLPYDDRLRTELEASVRDGIQIFNEQKASASRPNEAGSDFEQCLVDGLNGHVPHRSLSYKLQNAE